MDKKERELETSTSSQSRTFLNRMEPLLLPAPVANDAKSFVSDNEQQMAKESRLRWIGMDPLTWIELLSSETEERELETARATFIKTGPPLRIKGVPMATASPAVQISSCSGTPNRKLDNSIPMTDSLCTPRLSVPTLGNEDCKAAAEDIPRQSAPITTTPLPACCFNVPSTPTGGIIWDLSFLVRCDPQASDSCTKMQTLAQEIEAIARVGNTVEANYKRIRDHLSFTFDWILSQATRKGRGAKHEQRMLLNILYAETIHKMEALLSMAQERPSVLKAASVTSTPSKANQRVDKDARVSSTAAKKEFSKYMTTWLRNNWTNPYPDDDGLTKIADDCGVTQTIVSNWLINARTRKWRPAIMKAFKMERPIDMLLEDSLNVFDGNCVRELPKTHPTEGTSPKKNKRAKHNV